MPISSSLMDRVIGIDLSTLSKAKRVVGIAGGIRKTAAIHAALKAKRINVLITDRATAERLLKFK
jgi:deoxyribonucleoside regulator